VTVSCNRPQETTLVALPSTETSTDTLMTLGLSRAAAETVGPGGSSTAARWCNVEDAPDADKPPPAGTMTR
jgi:hypothetical protein